MLLKKKIYKPKYKSLIIINENLYKQDKILNFKKKKWFNSVLVKKFKKKIKSDKLICLFDHSLNYRPKANFFFIKRFKQNLLFKKKICTLFGFFKIKTLKHIKFRIKSCLINQKSSIFFNKIEQFYIDFFESNLYNVLQKSYLATSVRESRDFINKGYVYVNNKNIFKYSYKVKKGDFITFATTIHGKLLKNFNKLVFSTIVPVPVLPDYMEVNYKTLQIIIFSNKIDKKYSNHYPFKLELKRLNRFLL